MRKITLLFSLIAAFVLLPGSAKAAATDAQLAQEFIAITATAATSSQTSGIISRPRAAKAIMLWLNVTAGSTLLIDVDLQVYSPTLDSTIGIYVDCPSAEGVTGVGATLCFLGTASTSEDMSPNVKDQAGSLPTLFQLLVRHGNANAATYVLYYQWIY